MVPDWKALLPHRPLDPETDQYVAPPASGGERIAQWILADRTTVLVAGPVGIGKSTELARAAKLLENDRLPFLIRLDRFENMKRVSVDQILLRIAGQMVLTALSDHDLSVSSGLIGALILAKVLPDGIAAHATAPSASFSAPSLLKLAIAELSRVAPRRVVVLLDGLEKLPEGTSTSEVFDALGMLSDDIDLVVVLPWTLAFGSGPDTILRAGEHIVTLRALEVEGDEGAPGRTFLCELLARRLGLPVDVFAASLTREDERSALQRPPVSPQASVASAAVYSGGVPRTFLQLVADAGTYARMRRKDPWPTASDVLDAVADQEDSFRRILRRGDNDAIHSVEGKDGRELELERKIRLLAHGVLLERVRGGTPVLTVHPLVARLLNPQGASRA